MASSDCYLFWKVVRYFRKCQVCDLPFRVRRLKLKGLDGSCQHCGTYYLIKIDKRLNQFHAIDVFLHEIAHALSWDKEVNIHGSKWGQAYSKVYRIFEKFIEGGI